MKFIFIITSIVAVMGSAYAGDESCQVNLLKPKINHALILPADAKPAKLTLTDAKTRLRNSQEVELITDEQSQDTAQVENDEATVKEDEKEESRLGGIFDILLPSKLRNPVK